MNKYRFFYYFNNKYCKLKLYQNRLLKTIFNK